MRSATLQDESLDLRLTHNARFPMVELTERELLSLRHHRLEDLMEEKAESRGRFFRILKHIDRCYGCRTCELACSFHHKGVFAPELSSIKISRCNQTGVLRWHVDPSCDSCVGEDQPLCVKYCSYGALEIGEGS
jgi:NAD-dependent dihydropyrimidine dehydrogenase PreA subunit